ncbi:uncharacterized protein METZ01_LOCUS458972, partial [marine metagenome]
MLKRTLALITVIFAGSLLVAITAKSDNQMIPSEEVQKMNELRNKMIESKAIEGQNILQKVEKSLIKKYKQSPSRKNKIMGMIQLQKKASSALTPRNEIRIVGEYNGNTNRDCSDCEFDFTAYGSECCDSAWDEYGINCADLEANYNWDCAGCTCPGDQAGECGDGTCNVNEDCETCEADCGVCGECDAGYITDCADNDCCPESWIGDGFADCEDQAYGCDLT